LTSAPFAKCYVGGIVTLVADGAVDWRSAGNVETNYVQHVARNQGSKINIRLSSIAVVRLSYQTFAFLVLGRIGVTLDAEHPKENSMDSEPIDASKNICLQQTSHLVKTLTFDVPMWHTCRNIAGYVGC